MNQYGEAYCAILRTASSDGGTLQCNGRLQKEVRRNLQGKHLSGQRLGPPPPRSPAVPLAQHFCIPAENGPNLIWYPVRGRSTRKGGVAMVNSQ